jgi:hypothetical protein
LPSSRGTTRVDSIPSGAEVFVMGNRVGTTPLEVEDARVYPVQYPSELAPLYGKLVLRHPGCEELVQNLDLRAANEGVVAHLGCGVQDRRADASPNSNPDAARTSATAPTPKPPQERLAEIDALRREGLVTEAEARALRERALREALDGRPAADALRLLDGLRAAGSIEEPEYAARRAEILGRL